MRIDRIEIFQVEVPLRGGGYRRGAHSSGPAYASTIVRIRTEEGVTGLGEVCPIGLHYGAGWDGAALDGAKRLAPLLIGESARHIGRLNAMWDKAFRDDDYVKTPFDMALWDIAGKVANRPVSDLLGGTWPDPLPLYRSIYLYQGQDDNLDTYLGNMRAMRDRGFRHFQIKSGGDLETDVARIKATCGALEPGEKIIFDANTDWTVTQALHALKELRGLTFVLEQPCATLEEIAQLRAHWDGSLKLDESILTARDVIRGAQVAGADIVGIKVGRVGGLTKAVRLRDLAVSLGLSVVADDIWGGEIVSASLAHFAQSTNPRNLVNTTDLTDYVDRRIATGFSGHDQGTLIASSEPGLGIELDEEAVGPPVAVFGEAA
jgi:L-alanine-DL-glutamate epimerase-like enolase superfamily enzyme